MSEKFYGIDVGNGNTKIGDIVFSSGVRVMTMEPPILDRCVEWNGKYYIVGNPKMDIQKSKTENDNTLVLTMAGLAEKMKQEHITTANVRLGIGLPLTRVGAEKEDYANYMLRNRRLSFKYEGKSYSIFLVSVDVYPQGYAGVIGMMREFGTSTIVIDVGSWTVDILPIINGRPDVARCKSLSLGAITCMNEIEESLRQKFNEEAGEETIKEVMMKGTSNINPEYLKVIQDGLYRYVDDIMNNLRALKFSFELSEFVFIGGGASIIKNFLKEKRNIRVIEDVSINAKGYEALLRHQYKAGV